MRLVRFTADWCQPCKQFAPQFDAAVAALGIEAEVLDIEDDNNLDAVQANKVMGIPALFLVDNDEQWHRLDVGPAPAVVQQVEALR